MKNHEFIGRKWIIIAAISLFISLFGGIAYPEDEYQWFNTDISVRGGDYQYPYDPYYNCIADYYAGHEIKENLNFSIYGNTARVHKLPYKLVLYQLTTAQVMGMYNRNQFPAITDDSPLPIIYKSEGTVTFDRMVKDYSYFGQKVEIPISFGKLNPGFYLLNLTANDREVTKLMQVSNAGLIVKAWDNEILLFAQDKMSSNPISGMDIYGIVENNTVNIGKTDSNGILRFRKSDLPAISKDEKEQEKFFIMAKNGDDIALCETIFTPFKPNFMGYIYTDRPIYRPGQTVNFKGILREKRGNKMKPVTGKEVEVTIHKVWGQKIYQKNLLPNEYGSISDNLELRENLSPGRYSISVVNDSIEQVGYFSVEEYRKPEYELIIKPLNKFVNQGEKARFEVEARYYFGKPVPNAEITYEIDQGRNYYALLLDLHCFDWDTWSSFYNINNEILSRNVSADANRGDKKRKITTDAQGKAIIEIDTNHSAENIYTVKAEMSDSSGRPVTAESSIRALPGDVNVSVNFDRNYYFPGEPVKITIMTRNIKGEPVSIPVLFDIVQPVSLRYDETNTATYKRKIILSKSIETDESGTYNYEFHPQDYGEDLQILASAHDSNGNKIWGFREMDFLNSNQNDYFLLVRFLESKKGVYRIGENVEFTSPDIAIKNGSEKTLALLTLETDKVIESRVVEIQQPSNSFTFKIDKDMAPTTTISLSTWKSGSLYSFAPQISMEPEGRYLKVQLDSGKNRYSPGEEISIKLQTKNKMSNEPVSSEVSLAVADESVFSLIPGINVDIKKFFFDDLTRYGIYSHYTYYNNYSPSVTTFNSHFQFKQTRAICFYEVPNIPGTNLKDPPIRQYFPDTCYFNPHIITDEKGEATVHVKLPDSLTTWRATAVANSKDSEFGQAEEKVVVSKDILVRLITPRFLVEKDEVSIMGIVHNYLDKAVEAEVSLEAEGVELLSPKTVKVEIQPGKKADAVWNVRAVKPGEAKFTVKALTTEESDAVLMKIPLLAHGSKVTETKAGSTEDSLTLTFSLPEGASKESAVLRLNLAPSLAGTLIDALEYLADYPYGCVEQTMSRFIPNAIVQSSMKEWGIRNEMLEKKLPDMMKEGFKMIYEYQHKDGGWGWWKNDKTKPLMTALVVYGLSLADKAGYDVDRAKLLNGSFMLKNQLMKITDMNERAYILFALSEADVKMNYFVNSLFEKRDKLDNYSRALLAITLYKHDEKEKAKIILESLEKTAKSHDSLVYWEGKGNNSWSDNPVEATAYAVQAFLLIDPENPIVEKAVRYLTISRRGRCWYSTKDTAAAVLAVLEYAKKTKEMDPEFDASIYLNGKKLKDIKFTKNDIASGGLFVNVKGEELNSGENTVTVEKSGKGRAYLAGSLTSYLKTEKVKAFAKGFTVKRKYYLVTKKTEKEINAEKKRRERKGNYGEGGRYDGYESYSTNDENPSEKLIPLNEKELITLKPRDIVEVSLYIMGKKGMEYVMLEDMKPAGFEFVKDDENRWRYWYGQSEFRDDRAVFFMDKMWGKSKVFRYRLRAETPGEYRVLPATASQMYFPDVSGGSEEFIVKVGGEK